jgi:hypothetical protein
MMTVEGKALTADRAEYPTGLFRPSALSGSTLKSAKDVFGEVIFSPQVVSLLP